MATDIAESIASGLRAGGFRAQVIELAANQESTLAAAAAAHQLKRILVLQIEQWKSEEGNASAHAALVQAELGRALVALFSSAAIEPALAVAAKSTD